MRIYVLARLAALLAIVLTLTACLGNDSGGTTTPPTEAAATETTAASADGGSDTETTETTVAASDAGGSEAVAARGNATLTVGDLTWTFDNFYCRFGPENTKNDRVSFSSGSFSTHEGVRTQLDVSIQDTDKQGRYEGDGTIHSVTFNDIEDFENPSVAVSAESGFVGSAEFVVQIVGDQVTVDASFDDSTTDEIEAIPGTLEATCEQS